MNRNYYYHQVASDFSSSCQESASCLYLLSPFGVISFRWNPQNRNTDLKEWISFLKEKKLQKEIDKYTNISLGFIYETIKR